MILAAVGPLVAGIVSAEPLDLDASAHTVTWCEDGTYHLRPRELTWRPCPGPDYTRGTGEYIIERHMETAYHAATSYDLNYGEGLIRAEDAELTDFTRIILRGSFPGGSRDSDYPLVRSSNDARVIRIECGGDSGGCYSPERNEIWLLRHPRVVTVVDGDEVKVSVPYYGISRMSYLHEAAHFIAEPINAGQAPHSNTFYAVLSVLLWDWMDIDLHPFCLVHGASCYGGQ